MTLHSFLYFLVGLAYVDAALCSLCTRHYRSLVREISIAFLYTGLAAIAAGEHIDVTQFAAALLI